MRQRPKFFFNETTKPSDDLFLFDENHFQKFLKKEDSYEYAIQNNRQIKTAPANNNIIGGINTAISGQRRKRQNILCDFKFKKIDELF